MRIWRDVGEAITEASEEGYQREAAAVRLWWKHQRGVEVQFTRDGRVWLMEPFTQAALL